MTKISSLGFEAVQCRLCNTFFRISSYFYTDQNHFKINVIPIALRYLGLLDTQVMY